MKSGSGRISLPTSLYCYGVVEVVVSVLVVVSVGGEGSVVVSVAGGEPVESGVASSTDADASAGKGAGSLCPSVSCPSVVSGEGGGGGGSPGGADDAVLSSGGVEVVELPSLSSSSPGGASVSVDIGCPLPLMRDLRCPAWEWC